MGGNAPIFANAIADLGIKTTLVGMLGCPAVHPVFEKLKEKDIDVFSFQHYTETDCYEFQDGKIIISPFTENFEDPYESILKTLMLESFRLEEYDLVALLNWGEISWMHALWKNCISHEFSANTLKRTKAIFVDPSDISARTDYDISLFLNLLSEMRKNSFVIMSINENEAARLITFYKKNNLTLGQLAEIIVKNGIVDEITIHTFQSTIAFNEKEYAERKTRYVEKPVISTGAGDHFNAGYAFSSVHNYPLREKIDFANNICFNYLTTGR